MKIESSVQRLALGLSPKGPVIFERLLGDYTRAIKVGINRTEASLVGKDGGLMAIDTGVLPITLEQAEKIKPGEVALSCAFAGTNWVVTKVWMDENNRVNKKELSSYDMSGFRGEHTVESLTDLMAMTILMQEMEDKVDLSKVVALGVGFGFAQDNEITDQGVDARLNDNSSSKDWKILLEEGEAQPLIGEMLLEKLTKYSHGTWQAKTIAIENDTKQIANDVREAMSGDGVSILPVGFVFGTGSNACVKEYNLEAGKQVIEPDVLSHRLHELRLLPTEETIVEYMMGGDYLIKRLGAGLQILGEKDFVSDGEKVAEMVFEKKGDFLSRVAEGTITLYENDEANALVQETAIYILDVAADYIAGMIISVSQAGGHDFDEPDNPVKVLAEGGVLFKGYRMLERVNGVIKGKFPESDLRIVKADGVIGAGLQALVLHSEKKIS